MITFKLKNFTKEDIHSIEFIDSDTRYIDCDLIKNRPPRLYKLFNKYKNATISIIENPKEMIRLMNTNMSFMMINSIEKKNIDIDTQYTSLVIGSHLENPVILIYDIIYDPIIKEYILK